MSTLSGKVVLITGAANGIGAGTARALAARGARLILTDLDREGLERVATDVGGGDVAFTAVCDVCDLESMQSAVAAGVERFGGIDLVLANAGIASYGSVLGVDPAAFRRVIDVNLIGPFHTVRAALPHVIERRGYILIVSSLAAYAPAPGLAAYNASKAGVEHFASALRLEVAHRGVEIGTAHMSWIDTALVRDARRDLGAFGDMLSKLPGPLKRTTSVEACVRNFVDGLEHRRRRVNVPGWVGLFRWLKPVLSTPVGERETLRHAGELVSQMDAQVQRLGRSLSERSASQQQSTTTTISSHREPVATP